MKISEKIHKHRNEKELSLDKLASLTGLSKSYLWELENPRTNKSDKKPLKPSAEVINKIARALDLSTDYLLNERTTPNRLEEKEVFFRKFSNLTDEDQKKLGEIVDLWSRKE